jgi:tRNA (mo5U34)-methyltransferase
VGSADPEAARNTIERLGPWFHNVHLPGGLQTAPDHPLGDFPGTKWRRLALHLPIDLTGWRVLDIGCNAGYYTVELARRGAYVTGIDINPHYLEQARWVARTLGLEQCVELRHMHVYDLAHSDETYDLILFMGVFYHLRYPLLGLDIVAQKVRQLLVFQTLTMPGDEVYEQTDGLDIDHREPMHESGWPKLAFIEHRFAGDPTNWWVPNHAGVEAMLRSSGMRLIRQPGHELYICEPDPAHPACISTWNAAEILSATGRPWRNPPMEE